MPYRFFLMSLCLSACASTHAAPPPDAPPVPGPLQGQGYALVFRDEFTGKAGAPADKERWNTWAPGPRKGAFNLEDACRLDGQGHLLIAIRRGDGRIETGGVTSWRKFEGTHGYFECRCRLQRTEGAWSAFWIQSPTVGKPANDPAKAGVEIDVMEYLATRKKDMVQHTLHWNGYDKEHHKTAHVLKKVPGLSEGFHTFAVKWDAQGYFFYTDGAQTGRIKEPVSERPQHLILSCEVGPWAGDIAKGTLPDDFAVDFVRVWQTPAQTQADRVRAAEKK